MATNPTQVQEYRTGFAPEIAPFAQKLLGDAQLQTDINQNPYMQYMGERVAQFTPLQQQSYKNAALMQSSPQLKDATALAGQAGLAALNTQYSFKPTTNQFTAPGAYGNTAFSEQKVTAPLDAAEQTSTRSIVDQGTIDQYMSPFMQNVVQRQQLDAQRQADIARQVQGAQAARSGAFGGSGDYLQRAQAAANLARQKGDIQATGSQAAYQQAQQQFNAEQAARLQSQIANQQAGLTVGQQKLQAQLANQQANMTAQQAAEASKQFGYGQGMQSANLAAQYGQSAAQLNAQQQQFGAGLGLQGLQTALSGAQNLGNLGNTQYQQNMGINQMQNQLGGQQQQQEQNILNNQYQDYLNYQNYPYKQMGFMSDMIRGLPLSQQSSTIYQQPPSMLQQVAGAGITAKALGAFAGGGSVDDSPAGLADLAIYRMGQD